MEDGGYLVWKSKCASPNTRRAFPRLLGFHSESFYILPSVRAALEDGDRGQHSWGLRLLLLLLMRAPDIWLQKKNGRYRDARSGLSLCPRGTAGQLWGRSPSASPPATACEQKRGSFTQTGGWQTKRIHVDPRSPHMGKRANVIDIKRNDDNWKRRRKTLKLKSLSGFQQVTAVSLTLSASVVRGSDALEPLLSCRVPSAPQKDNIQGSMNSVPPRVGTRTTLLVTLTAGGWRGHPAPRSAPSQSQHRSSLCSFCRKHPCKT